MLNATQFANSLTTFMYLVLSMIDFLTLSILTADPIQSTLAGETYY